MILTLQFKKKKKKRANITPNPQKTTNVILHSRITLAYCGLILRGFVHSEQFTRIGLLVGSLRLEDNAVPASIIPIVRHVPPIQLCEGKNRKRCYGNLRTRSEPV